MPIYPHEGSPGCVSPEWAGVLVPGTGKLEYMKRMFLSSQPHFRYC